MASFFRSTTVATVAIIASFFFLVPMTAWGQSCSSVSDHAKRNADGTATCYCPNATVRCEWRGAGSPTTQVGGAQQPITDPGVLINNQLINNQSATPPPVTSSEFGMPRPNQNQFTALAGVPGITNLGNVTMGEFVNALYRMLIVIGALWAVLKITLAGLKYMGSDNFGNKAEAKEDIKSSLLGLLILLATALIITTVMGGVDLNAFRNTPIIPYTPQSPPPLNAGAGGGSTVGIKKEAGCNQMSANNVSCSEGRVGTISGSKIECHAQNNIPYVSGQDTFKPVTETACVYTGGHQAIQGGGLIYGNHTLSVAELRSKYGNSLSAQEVLDAHKASILETCRTMSSNPNATIAIKSPGMIGGGFWSSSELAYFTCSS